MIIRFFVMILLFSIFCISCFDEVEKTDPILYEFDSEIVELPFRIYDTTVYFDLSTAQVVEYHNNNAWDMAFHSGSDQHRIIINSSDLLELANVGSVDFGNYTSLTGEEEWLYDASSGNSDSSATGNWVDTAMQPYHYTHDLYILGRSNGLSYQAVQKLQFIYVDESAYQVLHGPISGITPDTLIIQKDDTYNFVGFSFRKGNILVNYEPPKNNWDIVFKQYLTTLYTNDGVATPYSVRGVQINPSKVSVASDSASLFKYFHPDVGLYSYSSQWDIIGWDWKDVTIDEASNTAVYVCEPTKIYIIKNGNNTYFKLHFLSFYNPKNVAGFITFEYAGVN